MCNFKTIAWRIHSHLIKSLSKIGPPTPHILAPPWPNIGSWGYFINKSEMYSYMYYLAVILFSQLQLQSQFSSEKLFSIMVLERKIFMTPQPIFYLSLFSTLWSRPSGHIFLKNSESPYSKGALRKVWLNLVKVFLRR